MALRVADVEGSHPSIRVFDGHVVGGDEAIVKTCDARNRSCGYRRGGGDSGVELSGINSWREWCQPWIQLR